MGGRLHHMVEANTFALVQRGIRDASEDDCPSDWSNTVRPMMKLKLLAMIGLMVIAALPAAAFAGRATSDNNFGVDPCYKQCSPLLGSVKPQSEAQRVFKNCMNYCQKKGQISCGNGVFVNSNRFCPGNRLRAF